MPVQVRPGGRGGGLDGFHAAFRSRQRFLRPLRDARRRCRILTLSTTPAPGPLRGAADVMHRWTPPTQLLQIETPLLETFCTPRRAHNFSSCACLLCNSEALC